MAGRYLSGVRRVPDAVRRKARALGSEGERWVDQLAMTVADLEARWGLTVGEAISGGSAAFVAEAVTDDGTPLVLKVAMPDGLEGNGSFDRELETLRLGDGRGYVAVLRSDVTERAMLLERLGRPLSALGYPVERQIDVLAETLDRAWRPAPDAMELRTGAEQAAFLLPFVRSRWERLDAPCPEPVVGRAEAFARSRRDAFDPTTAVLVHGDAHVDNVLEDGRGGFKLIDPEGMRSERAHDLAMQLRDWTDELLAVADPAGTGLEWCRRLGERTGVDPVPIWEWAYLERVSTGLFLLELGDPSGAGFLQVAEQWVDAHP